MKATSPFWAKNIEEIRRATIRQCGTKAKINRHRDANGDYDGIESIHATLRLELVDRDLELVIDVTDNPPKSGLSFADFCGLRDARKGEDDAFGYAVFADGRSYRVLDWRTPEITDPAEITARELRFSRMHHDAVEPGKAGKRKYQNWAIPVQKSVLGLWTRYAANPDHPNARLIDCYAASKGGMPDCIKSLKDFKDCLAAARKSEKNHKAMERRWNHVSSR